VDIVVVDTETTGLDADLHEVWEVAAVKRSIHEDGNTYEDERHWFLPVTMQDADPMALKISGYYERCPEDPRDITGLRAFASEFVRFTLGCTLIGALPSFDEERIRNIVSTADTWPAGSSATTPSLSSWSAVTS
jgi:hypothetical protein